MSGRAAGSCSPLHVSEGLKPLLWPLRQLAGSPCLRVDHHPGAAETGGQGQGAGGRDPRATGVRRGGGH